MLFSEIYGKYYQAVGAVLSEAVQGGLAEGRIEQLVREHAFAESTLRIPAALKDGSWPLLDTGAKTPIRNVPSMPLTELEKRWLKSLLSDPRIRLFDPPAAGLEDVRPLFDPKVFVYYDRYTDGDPYEDENYKNNFKTVLAAFREKRKLEICFLSHRGQKFRWRCVPYGLEYSPKDDKFRLITGTSRGRTMSVNIARITECGLLEPYAADEYLPVMQKKESLVLELVDERNALERAMLHFSHLERETERIGENNYRVTLYYEKEDRTEMLIRVLSFGSKLRVVAPEGFAELVRERIERQQALLRG